MLRMFNTVNRKGLRKLTVNSREYGCWFSARPDLHHIEIALEEALDWTRDAVCDKNHPVRQFMTFHEAMTEFHRITRALRLVGHMQSTSFMASNYYRL